MLASGQYKIIYAPDENLERQDGALLGSARSTIDAALYSATDVTLCDALAKAAHDGVRVRVYRDREQYGEEEQRARGRGSCTAELIANGAEVKVKAGEDLMHMKSYAVDGEVLRTGSANLSQGGERYQDNDAVFIASDSAAKGFERNFAEMWSRPNNVVVQAAQ
jgi:phosphatidylserine/phosphatidylglycerophosphate/cardiolipin synthase-like enzyme